MTARLTDDEIREIRAMKPGVELDRLTFRAFHNDDRDPVMCAAYSIDDGMSHRLLKEAARRWNDVTLRTNQDGWMCAIFFNWKFIGTARGGSIAECVCKAFVMAARSET